MNTVSDKIVVNYYIASGRKNGFYTLRCNRSGLGFFTDSYIRTLAATEELAVTKATAYFEAMAARVPETERFVMLFDPEPNANVYARRGKLSVRDSQFLNEIENGRFPFGKHAHKEIESAPESYLLYFADMVNKPDLNEVMVALVAACQGVALEKGYIAKRDEKRAAQAEIDALSWHVGEVGQRLMFEGTVDSVFFKKQEVDGGYSGQGVAEGYWINKIRCGHNIIVYMGSKKLGEKGEAVSFKATVKQHSDYKGVKTTKVNRPF